MKELENQSNNIGYLLYHLTIELQRAVKQKFDPIGITHTQFIILATIYRLSSENKPINQIEIAKQSGTDKMMVSKLLRTLEEKQLIGRKEDVVDTRSKNVTITPKGVETFKNAFTVIKKVESDFFEPLGDEKTQFAKSLQIILNKNKNEN